MQKLILKITFMTLFTIVIQKLKAQGCSDAGFCTMNNLKLQASTSKVAKGELKIGVSTGAADNDINIVSNHIAYTYQIGKKFIFDAKLTSLSQSGNGISNFGLSDLFLSGNIKTNKNIVFTIGTKLPLTAANKQKNNLPLPMDYQSSLGTVDLILGTNIGIKKFNLALALQQPLTQNENQFSNNLYNLGPLTAFQSTNNFKRAGDVLLRLSRSFNIKNKLSVTPSILNIYHLAEDKFTVGNVSKVSIAGSSGLTVNGTILFDYIINEKNALQLQLAAPFKIRATRPDGLTRAYVAGLEYSIRF